MVETEVSLDFMKLLLHRLFFGNIKAIQFILSEVSHRGFHAEFILLDSKLVVSHPLIEAFASYQSKPSFPRTFNIP